MEYTNKIRQWAIDRNLHTQDSKKQALKLMEEVGELAQGLAKGRQEQVVDSIGDIYVVLVILAMQEGLQIEDCIEAAYMEIKDRTGKIVNGSYIKESDLKENEKCY